MRRDQPVIRPEVPSSAPQGHGVRGIEQQDGNNYRCDNAREHRGERRARDACVKAVDHCCVANYIDNINPVPRSSWKHWNCPARGNSAAPAL